MSKLSIKSVGTGKVIRKLTYIGERGANVAPAWPAVADMISEEVALNFETQGARFGKPWVPLADSTMAKGHPGPPLVRTGRLRRKLTTKRLPIIRLTGTTMTIGTTDRVATWQHGGTRRNGRRHIPPRVLIKASPLMARKARKILARYVLTGKIK